MVLNFISNFAAAQALRFVNINSADAQSSVAKLASGSPSRVVFLHGYLTTRTTLLWQAYFS